MGIERSSLTWRSRRTMAWQGHYITGDEASKTRCGDVVIRDNIADNTPDGKGGDYQPKLRKPDGEEEENPRRVAKEPLQAAPVAGVDPRLQGPRLRGRGAARPGTRPRQGRPLPSPHYYHRGDERKFGAGTAGR